MDANATCLDCKHISYSSGSPGYSEYTPGWDAELSCIEGVWTYDAFNDELKDVRDKLYTARTCSKFEKGNE